ncbi:uracil-DNA glycosylase [Pirellulaceae bacterium SH467]
MNSWASQAAKQLFQSWARSGVTHVPRPSDLGVRDAEKWLDQWSVDSGIEAAKNLGVHPSSPLNNDALSLPSPERSVAAPATPPVTPTPLPTSTPRPAATPLPSLPAGQTTWSERPVELAMRIERFRVLQEDVAACRKCTEIVCRRQKTVFGVGPTNARIVMFGEAPGADEDRAGEPFVGAAGQLMDKILVASGLSRDEVYIMNALRCRPPNNRTPTEAEIENCRPFFESQLETIQPEYIVCWGAVAVRAVLRSTESVGRLRGKFHNYRGAKVMVTYHPAYLLRNPDAKRLTWDDMKMLMRELGIPIPPPKRA